MKIKDFPVEVIFSPEGDRPRPWEVELSPGGARVIAEGVAAVEATVVVEHPFIQNVAENYASGSARRAPQQSANDGTADTAHGRTDGTGNDPKGSARLGTSCGSRITTIGTGRSTDHTGSFLAVVIPANTP
jgi:hypothetical protein